MSQETLLKCIMLPDSSAIPLFDKLAPENELLTTNMQKFDKISVLSSFGIHEFVQTAAEGFFHWFEDTGIHAARKLFMPVDVLETLEFTNPDRKHVQDKLFDTKASFFFDFKTTTLLKTTMFKISILPGYKDSVELHETLAASVLNKDTNDLLKTESIKGILEYKFT